MVFSHMAILTSKAFTSGHLSHVLISIFIVFLLRTDRTSCIVFVRSVLTVQVQDINWRVLHIIEVLYMYFLHVASP